VTGVLKFALPLCWKEGRKEGRQTKSTNETNTGDDLFLKYILLGISLIESLINDLRHFKMRWLVS